MLENWETRIFIREIVRFKNELKQCEDRVVTKHIEKEIAFLKKLIVEHKKMCLGNYLSERES